MEKISKNKIGLKLDMIQQSIWKNEDFIIKTLGMIEMNRSEIQEIKNYLSLINEKIDRLDLELRGQRVNGKK